MPTITFGARRYDCAPGQTVLECLNAAGNHIPWGCGAGACQACLMRAVAGPISASAQAGLKPTQAAEGYFLACQARPTEDIEVCLGEPPAAPLPAHVVGLVPLTTDILRLRLRPSQQLSYRAGQFVRLHRADGESRCYSLASVPGLDDELELHVRRIPGGRFSRWIHEELGEGQEVGISAATGASYYLPDKPDRGLCLIGTGSGLAPLYGIARDALRQGHRGPVWLFHGAVTEESLYLGDALRALEAGHPNFRYVPCVSASPTPGLAHGLVHEVALERLRELDGWSVHLCGNPQMVDAARRATFLAGASLRDIHSDPFLPSAPHGALPP
jgi:ferredoxin-NADP reductase/ferredoxin